MAFRNRNETQRRHACQFGLVGTCVPAVPLALMGAAPTKFASFAKFVLLPFWEQSVVSPMHLVSLYVYRLRI